MKALAVFTAAGALAIAATAVWAGVGIPAVPIGLDHDPGGNLAVKGTTDARGRVMLHWRAIPGDKGVTIFIADRAALKAPVTMAIAGGGRTLLSAPITPGKGRGYWTDAHGAPAVWKAPAGTDATLTVTVTLAVKAPHATMTLTGSER